MRKHGVSFEVTQDRIERLEQRWQTLGMIGDYLVLLVAHTVGEDDDGIKTIRIISARAADRKERKRYENQDR